MRACSLSDETVEDGVESGVGRGRGSAMEGRGIVSEEVGWDGVVVAM